MQQPQGAADESKVPAEFGRSGHATPDRRSRGGSIDLTVSAATQGLSPKASDSVKVRVSHNYRDNDLQLQLDTEAAADDQMRYTRANSSEGLQEPLFSRGSILGARLETEKEKDRQQEWRADSGQDPEKEKEPWASGKSGIVTTDGYAASIGSGVERMYASNTIVASNGEIYHIEPMMLPPPSEIAALFKERRERNRAHSNLGDSTPDRQELAIASMENTPVFKGSYYHQKLLRERQAELQSQKKHAERSSDMFSMRDFVVPGRSRSNTLDGAQSDTSTAPGYAPIGVRSGATGSGTSTALHAMYGSAGGALGASGAHKSSPLADYMTSSSAANRASKSYNDNGEDRANVLQNSSAASSSMQMTGMASAVIPPRLEIYPAVQNLESMRRSAERDSDDNDLVNGDLDEITFRDQEQRTGAGSGSGSGSGSGRIFDIRAYASLDERDNEGGGNGANLAQSHLSAEDRAMSSSTYFHISKFSAGKYIMTEMLGVGNPSTGERQGQENIQNFLKVPYALESLLWLGFLVCLDSFVYVFTYLPVRCLYGAALLLLDASSLVLPNQLQHLHAVLKGNFQRSNAYDMARGLLVFIGCYALLMLNMSRVYHYIRGQTMIKLYVLTSMLEILDKLMSSFGQDAFDSLHYQLRSVKHSISGYTTAVMAFFVAAIYVIVHSSIYFIHVATLTVAINSAEQALVTVLILNNFAEIKSFVFKKFDRTNLFQLACSDITERFQITLYLAVIVFVALVQAGDEWMDLLPGHLVVMLMMYIGECLSDWVKHAFISKFNHIDASVYEDFSRVLRKDILSYQKDKEKGVDRTYAITRRVGLSQIPLACVTIRYLNLAWSSPQFQYAFSQYSLRYRCMFVALLFVGTMLFKVLFGVGIFFYAGFVHNRELVAREQKNTGMPSAAKASASALSNIERYTTHKGHVIG